MSTPNELMRHALGVQKYYGRNGERWSKPYRNRFIAGDKDTDAWCTLAAAGMAKLVHNGNELTDGCPTFIVTDAGREHALDGLTFKRRWGYGRPVNP